jgi:ribonuclease inhibitor
MIVVIDGNKFDNLEGIHLQFQKKLELPDYYGKNLDALWDCLSGHVKLPLTIVLKNLDYSQPETKDYLNKLIKLFERAEDELSGFYFVAIEKKEK